MMSGSILYPPTTHDGDASILFVETSGCLPMCGHGTIGTVTMGIELGLVSPTTPGRLLLDTPAGRVVAEYDLEGDKVAGVRIYNVPSYLAHEDVRIKCPEPGELSVDVAYGGNFYAIIESQANYIGLEVMQVGELLRLSPAIRALMNDAVECGHPLDPTVRGVSHVQWTGQPLNPHDHGRNAVFYGGKAVDRLPFGTGTSVRMAQLAARGELKSGDEFVHENIIGSIFEGRHEGDSKIGDVKGMLPSICGWARMTGFNTVFVYDHDPFAHGFQVV